MLIAVGVAGTTNYPGVYPKPLFATTGKAAYCTVEVEGYEDSSPRLFCWTPNDGWTININWIGKRAATRLFDKPPQIVHSTGILRGYVPKARLLPFGTRWVYRCANPAQISTCRPGGAGATAFTCTSARTGLTCRNAVRHGFWIGRYRGYRRF